MEMRHSPSAGKPRNDNSAHSGAHQREIETMSNIDDMTNANVLVHTRAAIEGLHQEGRGKMKRTTRALAALIAGYDVAVKCQDVKALGAYRTMHGCTDSELVRDSLNRILVASGFAMWNDDDSTVSWNPNVGFKVTKEKTKTGEDKLTCPEYTSMVSTIKQVSVILQWVLQVEQRCTLALDELITFDEKTKLIKIAGWFARDEAYREDNDTPRDKDWYRVDGIKGHASIPGLVSNAKAALSLNKAKASEAASKAIKLTTALDTINARAETMIAKGDTFDTTLQAKGIAAWALLCIQLGIADSDGANFDADKARTLFAGFINEWSPTEKTGTDNA